MALPKPAPPLHQAIRLAQAGLAALLTYALVSTLVARESTIPLQDLRRLVLGSGLDGRLPLALLVSAIVVLIATQPWQMTDLRHFSGLNPFPEPDASDEEDSGPRRRRPLPGFDVFHSLIGRELFWTRRSQIVGLACGSVAGIVLAALTLDLPILTLRSFEGHRFDLAGRMLLLIVSAFILIAGLQVWSIWRRIQQLLRRLAWHPLHAAFDRLPPRLAHDLGLKGTLRFPAVSAMGFSIEQVVMLANHLDRIKEPRLPNGVEPRTALDEILVLRYQAQTEGWAEAFRAEIRAAELGGGAHRAADSETMGRLLVVSRAVLRLLAAVWDARPLEAALVGLQGTEKWAAGKDGEEHSVRIVRRQVPDRFHAWIRLCEDFVATMTVFHLRFIFVILKRMLLGVIGATILLLFAIVSYPFQPRGDLTSWAYGMFAALFGLVVLLIVQTERDAILSRLANTEQHRVTFSTQLIMQFAVYILLPAFVLLTTQFPRLRDVLGKLAEPLLKAAQS
jgi:hypothetical protein